MPLVLSITQVFWNLLPNPEKNKLQTFPMSRSLRLIPVFVAFLRKGCRKKRFLPVISRGRVCLSKISATVSAFEENTGGKDAGFSFMGVSVGDDKGKAYMAVELKVMDTNTGEIADARTVKATSESSGMRLGLKLGFFSGNLGEKAKTPTGKAIRGCIVEISEYLECSLLKGKDSGCMKEYDEKDSKRKQKTKDSIKLE